VILIVKGGAKIGKRGSTVVVSVPKKDENGSGSITWETQYIPILDLEVLVVIGSRARISSGAILMLSEVGVPVLIHGKRGDAFLMNPFNVKIAEARRRLYSLFENPSWRITIGKAFIEGKLRGMVNLARYLAYKDAEKGMNMEEVLREIAGIEESIEKEGTAVNNIDELRIYEARWSKRLWQVLSTYIPSEYEFKGRDPKSRDPINAAISYTYAIIYGLCTHALIASGLDPYVGIVHTERAGKTSLTYDFSEMFKPIAMHATIITSRQIKISTDSSGYLTSNSLETITRHLYRLLKRKHEKWRYTARGEIYAKSWELRENIEKGKKFSLSIYRLK
jgi:CRISPR-associated protein Cas1